MTFIKHLFPCLNNSLQSSPKQTQITKPLLPLRKKALLIGIQNIRQDTIQITQDSDSEDDERAAEEDVYMARDRAEEGAWLKGPHRDVLEMKQLLISALYHHILFLPPAEGILAVV